MPFSLPQNTSFPGHDEGGGPRALPALRRRSSGQSGRKSRCHQVGGGSWLRCVDVFGKVVFLDVFEAMVDVSNDSPSDCLERKTIGEERLFQL